MRHRRYAVGETWDGLVAIPVFFPLGWQFTRVPPYVRRPFPSKENRHIGKGEILLRTSGDWGVAHKHRR